MLIFENIDKEIKDVNTNPTEKQKEAGNYKKAHITVKGMKISIENPKGSKRYYGDGKYNVMKNHYGYFTSTKGKDGDEVDVFLGPDIDDFECAYCIDQRDKDKKFDETKVMLGFKSKKAAKDAYLSNYEKGWDGLMEITEIDVEGLKKWLYRGRKQRQPFADYAMLKEMVERVVTGVLDESREYYSDLICRNPYVKLQFTEHCIGREYQREIFRGDIAYDVSQVIKQIAADFYAGNITDQDVIKVINKDTCLVCVCKYLRGLRKYDEDKLVVITTYIWDGRVNIDGRKSYFIGEESPRYLEAREWNREHQQEVRDYMLWRHGQYFAKDIEAQRRKADNHHYHRNNPYDSREKRLEYLNITYDKKERDDKKAVHKALPKDELRAIQQYFVKMNKMPLHSKGSFNRELYDMDMERKLKELEAQKENPEK